MSEFLAEASVLIQANTVAFRTELAAALATVPKTIEIPIVAVGGKGTAATSAATVVAAQQSIGNAADVAASKTAAAATVTTVALEEEAAAAGAAGVSAAQLAGAQASALQVNKAFAATQKAVALASLEVVGAASAQEAAEVTLQRQTAASIAARQLLTEAELAGLNTERLLQTELVQTALAMGEKATATKAAAVADEQAAAAARHHAVQISNVSRGAATSALAAIGLRGATLTANAAFIAGAAAAIGFGKAIQTATSFETNLNVFAATVGATGDEMEKVSEQARQLGQDVTLPGVSATDAADAMNELAKAGLSVDDSIAGARGVLQLATAAAIDNATAVQIAASALNAFGLAGDQAVHVADVLANAANLSQGSIADIGLSLQQTAAVSRQVGVSFEDTAALLTLLAQNGIKGSDAGTSLRVAFTRLINPTEKAQKVLSALNITLRDQAGNIRPEVFSDFAAAQAKLPIAQQQANAAIVFGTDALRAYSIISRESTQGLADVRDGLERQGAAADLAAARTKGLAGSVENLKNQLSTLGLSIGDLAKGPLTDFVDILAGGFENINSGLNFLNQLAGGADNTKQSFAELAQEAGKVNFAVFSRTDRQAGPGLLERQKELNDALTASLGPGIQATDMIEGYRDALHNAAAEAEGLRNRIDESSDRFAKTPVPVLPTGPTPIGPSAKFDRRAALAQASGNLSVIADVQREALARAQKALADSKGNVKQRTALFKQVTQAEASLASTQRQISEQAAAKTESDANAAKAARQKADQAILDSFSGGQNRIALAQISAQATDRLSDDLKLQTLIISTAKREQQIIENTVKDSKTRNTQIAQRVQTIKAARVERDRLEKEAADALTTKKADVFQAQVDLAAAEGNIPLQIRFNNIRIRAIDRLIASGKQVGAALNRLKAERAQKRQDNENLQNQQIQDRVALGQSIFDLTENKNPLVQALNAAVRETQNDIKAAKKAGKSTTVLQTELNNFLKQRKDVIEGAKDSAGADAGTTLADLFKSTQDVFNQAGTVGRLPRDLTSAAANQPIRDLVNQRLEIQLQTPTRAESLARSQMSSTERLITTLDQLISVIGQGPGIEIGGNKTAGKQTKAIDNAARYQYQRVANAIVEAGVWG